MMADVQRAREEAPRVRVGVIQDAALELWTLLRDGLRGEARLRRWDEGIDRYHLNERLAEILRITEPDATRRPCRGSLGGTTRWTTMMAPSIGSRAGWPRRCLRTRGTIWRRWNDTGRFSATTTTACGTPPYVRRGSREAAAPPKARASPWS
jgi:hypothetical protein